MFSYNNDLEFDIKTPVYNTCKPNYLKLVSSYNNDLEFDIKTRKEIN